MTKQEKERVLANAIAFMNRAWRKPEEVMAHQEAIELVESFRGKLEDGSQVVPMRQPEVSRDIAETE